MARALAYFPPKITRQQVILLDYERIKAYCSVYENVNRYNFYSDSNFWNEKVDRILEIERPEDDILVILTDWIELGAIEYLKSFTELENIDDFIKDYAKTVENSAFKDSYANLLVSLVLSENQEINNIVLPFLVKQFADEIFLLAAYYEIFTSITVHVFRSYIEKNGNINFIPFISSLYDNGIMESLKVFIDDIIEPLIEGEITIPNISNGVRRRLEFLTVPKLNKEQVNYIYDLMANNPLVFPEKLY